MSAIASPIHFIPPSSYISTPLRRRFSRPRLKHPKSFVSVSSSKPLSIENDTSWLAEMLSDLEKTISLETGWDSYDAPPPTALPIRFAQQFLENICREGLKPVSAGPSVMGGIGVTFYNLEREVFVEFYNKGDIYAMFADDGDPDDEPIVAPFSPEGNFSDLIPRIREFLDA